MAAPAGVEAVITSVESYRIDYHCSAELLTIADAASSITTTATIIGTKAHTAQRWNCSAAACSVSAYPTRLAASGISFQSQGSGSSLAADFYHC